VGTHRNSWHIQEGEWFMATSKRVASNLAECAEQPVGGAMSDVLLHKHFPFIQTDGSPQALPRRAEPRPSDLSRLRDADEPGCPFPSQTLSELTKSEVLDVVEILHRTMEATTGEDVHHVLRLLQRALACPKVIGGVAEFNRHGGFKEFARVLNVSYASDWLYAYCKNEYAGVDPVLRSLPSGLPSQTWAQSYSTARSQRQIEFIEEARSFGLTHGITTGLLDRRRGFATFFSFAGGDARGLARYRGFLEYLAPYLHRVLMAGTPAAAPERARGLSPREMTVLLWMKEGKTNWEIARIVGVTERTVRFHVESIFTKLDASSRTQAVAVALEQGLLSTE
jgi:LuxR family transcriptional regulator, quorum-sensing system regulator CviR